MDRTEADAQVARLGEQLGIKDLALDDAGSCTLFIDDGAVIVHIGHNRGAGTIDLMSCLDSVEPGDVPLSRVLEANFGWRVSKSAAFAIEPNSGALALQRRLAASDLGDGALMAALEELVVANEAWTKRLQDWAAEKEGGAQPPPGESGPSPEGMIRA